MRIILADVDLYAYRWRNFVPIDLTIDAIEEYELRIDRVRVLHAVPIFHSG